MKKLIIVRHGESLDDTEDRYGGFANYNLNENGIKSAKNLGEYLKNKDIKIDKIFTSPYLRAFQTANILNEYLNINPEIQQDIRERNTYGYLSGMKKSQAEELFPEDFLNAKDQKTADKIDGAELVSSVVERGENFLKYINDIEDENILIVTHGKFIQLFIENVLKINEETSLGDCGYYIIQFEEGKGKIVERYNTK